MKVVRNLISKISVGLSSLLAVPYGKQLEKFFSNIIEETPTVYDKAIDKFYNDSLKVFNYYEQFIIKLAEVFKILNFLKQKKDIYLC